MRKSDIRKKANDVLDRSKIHAPHVDVKEIAEFYGIAVKRISLPDDISGVLKRDNEEGTEIYVNKFHALVRQRFSIAHELGHYFLHENDGQVHIDKKNYSFRDKKSQEGVNPKEIEANIFAAELLMPVRFLEAELQSFSEKDLIDTDADFVEDLAKKFKVSVTAMSLRFQNLGFLPEVLQ